jgi:hypothetical protein
LKTDFGGLPIAFHLTGGEASDSRNFETLLDIGPGINPRAALGDKGYDSKSNREAAHRRARQSRIDPTPKTYPPSFRKFSTRVAPVSSKQSASQTVQAHRVALREDRAELRLVRRTCSWLHLDQIRPHGLGHCGFKLGQKPWN